MVFIYPSLLDHQIDGVGPVYRVATVTRQQDVLLDTPPPLAIVLLIGETLELLHHQ